MQVAVTPEAAGGRNKGGGRTGLTALKVEKSP